MNSDARRLQRAYAALDADARRTLLAFAEFLSARVPASAPPATPQPQPRRDGESVVAALKRLRATYPMLDSAALLDTAAAAMTRHALHGEPAAAVIDQLEALFRDAYAEHAGTRSGTR